MVNFDFHEIAFAVPLLAFSLSALVRGRARATMWWALPLVLVKEDQGFTVAAIGALMWLASVPGVAAAPGDDPEDRRQRGGRRSSWSAGAWAGRWWRSR